MYYHHTIGVFVPLAKRHYKQFILAFVALFIATIAMTTLSVRAASTEVVSGDTSAGENQAGWLFNRDLGTSTPYEFNKDASSIGEGSLYVLPISSSPADKFIAEFFDNTQIDELNSFSYDFQIGAGGTAADENEFYLNVYANFGQSDDNKFYDCRYNIVPTVGAVGSFTSVTFDPSLSYPVTTSGSSPYACPSVPSNMNLSSSDSNIRAFAINVGDTSAGDTGLDGYIDNVVYDTTNGTRVFDFEPTPQLQSSLSGGGHIIGDQTDVKKRKDKADISFGIDVEDYNIGTSGDVTVRFHDVSNDSIDKTTFHSSEITSFNYFTGTHSSCKSAANITAVGSLGGVEGYELIFRVGDAGSPGRGDTVRIELRDPEGTPVYDTHGGTDYNSISKCVGTARTALDNGNLTINKYD